MSAPEEISDARVTEVRPLAVIDPEDREAVRSLLAVLLGQNDPLRPDGSGLTAALREFVAPTPARPEEPHGLGAVVEDAGGGAWVRVAVGEFGWVAANRMTQFDVEGEFCGATYTEIAARRVLSGGVTA